MMKNKPHLPASCPSCGGIMKECSQCGAEVAGEFNVCPACRLKGDLRKLYDLFIKARGNLKQVQRELGISYPTVRLRIEEIFRKLGQHDTISRDPTSILARVRSGELSVDEAEQLLRGNYDTISEIRTPRSAFGSKTTADGRHQRMAAGVAPLLRSCLLSAVVLLPKADRGVRISETLY